MTTGSREPLGRLARVAFGLDLFLAVGALAGGAALLIGPRGEILPLPLSSLPGTPFDTYFVPGLICLPSCVSARFVPPHWSGAATRSPPR